jgi:hypothetical protein cdifQCD-6_20865
MLFYDIKIPNNQMVYKCSIPDNVLQKYGLYNKKEDINRVLARQEAPNMFDELIIDDIMSAYYVKDENDLKDTQVFILGVDLGTNYQCGTLLYQGCLEDKTIFVRCGNKFYNAKNHMLLFNHDYGNLVYHGTRHTTVEEVDKTIEENWGNHITFFNFRFCNFTNVCMLDKHMVECDGILINKDIVSTFLPCGRESWKCLDLARDEEINTTGSSNIRIMNIKEFDKLKVSFRERGEINNTPIHYLRQRYVEHSIFEHKSQERFTENGVLRITKTNNNPLLYHNFIPDKYKINDLTTKKSIERKTYTLGIELEVEAKGNEKDRNGIVNAVNLLNKNNLENKDRYFVVHDGSLNNGLEIVTHPFEININGVPNITKDLQELLHFLSYYTSTSDRCGLHIHIGRQSFKEDLPQKLNYIFELWNEDIMKVSRRGRENRYCKMPHLFRTDKKLMKLWNAKQSKLYDVAYTDDKYVAVNTNHSKTIEIRLWGGTQNPELISMYLELTLLLCVVANKRTYGELKEMELKDLIPLSNNKAFKKHMCQLLGVNIKDLTNKKKNARISK